METFKLFDKDILFERKRLFWYYQHASRTSIVNGENMSLASENLKFASQVALIYPTLKYATGLFNMFVLEPLCKKPAAEKVQQVAQLLPEVFEKDPKIRRDITFSYSNEAEMACSYGSNFCTPAFIFGNEEFEKIDKEAFNFIRKHEICHIYQSHSTTTCTQALSIAALSSLFIVTLPTPMSIFMSPVPLFFSQWFYDTKRQVNEIEADRFAILHSTDEELLGAARHFSGQLLAITSLLKKYQQNAPKLHLSSVHPHPAKRLKMLMEEISRRNIYQPNESAKAKQQIAAWKQYFLKSTKINYN